MLNGKVIVVTGGAGLLGQAFSKSIASENGIVIVADVDENRSKDVCVRLSSDAQSDNFIPENVDITSKESVQALIQRLFKRFGRIDAVVNNA